MSNEYKDWTYDRAQEVLLDHKCLKKITGVMNWNDGYLITGLNMYDSQSAYFVRLTAEEGWTYRHIDI